MAKWEGFSEEDIRKISTCERFMEGNIIFANGLLLITSFNW
jgi:hypothetical protein